MRRSKYLAEKWGLSRRISDWCFFDFVSKDERFKKYKNKKYLLNNLFEKKILGMI